jgi:hypothetical protein
MLTLSSRPIAVQKSPVGNKGNATKVMRERRLWRSDLSPWAKREVTKNLWTRQALINAIVYVLYDQESDKSFERGLQNLQRARLPGEVD